MTGLELITDSILKEAKAAADKKIEEATTKISGIKEETDKVIAGILEAEKQKREISVSELKERKEAEKKSYKNEMLLKTERETASELIINAKNKILELPADKYFELLKEIFDNQAKGAEGEILLTKEDKERMPEGFAESLGEGITLSEENISDRGFIIRQGRVEINCTFEAIFREMENKLYDIACCKE